MCEKIRQAIEHINRDVASIHILKIQIQKTKDLIEDMDSNINPINDKLKQLKQSSYLHDSKTN